MATRSCTDCKRWMFDDEPGRMGQLRIREATGEPYPRVGRTPCFYCPKTAHLPEKQRRPESAVEISDRNWLAYQHYLECRAVNQFPHDWLVRRNASIIRQAEELASSIQAARLALLRSIS
jgi:hypothetical protein